MNTKILTLLRQLTRKPSYRGAALGLLIMTTMALFSCKEIPKANHEQTRETQRNPPPKPAFGAPEIRVAIVKGVTELTLDATADQADVADASGRKLFRISPGEHAKIAASAGGLTVNGRRVEMGLRISGITADARVALEGRDVAPTLLVFADPKHGGRLTAVAQLDLEEYLTGVLAGEVPYDRWGAEPLKAQAVASRTYALYQMKARANEAYDVESTVASQVFRAGNRHNAVLNAAVQATRGKVLTYGGALIPAYFHSTCGGATAPAESVFGGQAGLAPLAGRNCPFCTHSPAYTWTAKLDKEALRAALQASPEARGQPIGPLRRMEFLERRGTAGRAESVRIHHGQTALTMRANAFRLAAGPGVLRSVAVQSITDRGNSFEFQGRGFGHGVGLCQYGSHGMGERGYGYAQILGFYYPGGELTMLYGNETALK